MDKLFIPKKIRVGYQERHDTYTKKLAYVIYYDSKGKIRKEKSFESWRDKKIKVDEFENKPHSGFVLNKGVQRYGHWGSGRNMIRVYDDRGIEFEITISNLMFILMTTDCMKRGLEGDFVYAWSGTELILLPTGCEEYAESQEFTSLQAKKIGAKDMIPGCSYKDKHMKDLIYMGRFAWHESKPVKRNSWIGDFIATKTMRHVFYSPEGYGNNGFEALSGLSSLASMNSDVPMSNYAKLLDKFNELPQSSPVVGLTHKEGKKFVFNEEKFGLEGNRRAILKEGDLYLEFFVSPTWSWEYGKNKLSGFSLVPYRAYKMVDGVFNVFARHSLHGSNNRQLDTLEELNSLNLVDVFMIFGNGNKRQITS